MVPSPRLVQLTLHLLQGVLTSAVVFPWVDAARRERLVRQWSRRLLSLCGVTCAAEVRTAHKGPPRALIVSNHTSWLDIFVINAHRPCRFVAMDDIRSWPLIGWLCHKNGTIFISRERRREVRQVHEGMIAGISAGERVAFFPEGGTADQGTVRPFHTNLFEVAIEAGVPIQPYAVRYVDAQGRLHAGTRFVGDMTFGESVRAILKARGLRAELLLLPAIDTAGVHRRELAAASRRAIARALGASLSP
jgi:1-acyl-sn-glycerol-3-phosphate acyltransferase